MQTDVSTFAGRKMDMSFRDYDYLQSHGYSDDLQLTQLDLDLAFAGANAKKIGNYIVEEHFQGNVLHRKVGQADKQPLKDRLATYFGSRYTRFRYKFAGSAQAAYDQECRDYHHFDGRSDNENHPDTLDGTKLTCPHRIG
jgi:hypothetical protein